MTNFEQSLKANPIRRVPEKWREEILASARQQLVKKESPVPSLPWWMGWLWPSPVAWAAVACTWLLILGLNFASLPSSAETSAAIAALPPGAIQKALLQQQQIVQELFRQELEPVAPPRRREGDDAHGASRDCVTQLRTGIV